MTVPKKIFIWGAFSDVGTWHAEKQSEVQIEYTLSTEVDELVKALELALDLIAVYGAENSKDGGKIKKMLAQYRKE